MSVVAVATAVLAAALAFKNADGSMITEIYNKGTSAKTTIVAVGSALYRFDLPAHGWATLRTTP